MKQQNLLISILASYCLLAASAFALEINHVVVLSKPGQPFKAQISISNDAPINTKDLQVRLVPVNESPELKALAKSIKVGSFGFGTNSSILLDVNSPLETPQDNLEVTANVRLNETIAAQNFYTKETGNQINAALLAKPKLNIQPNPTELTQSNESITLADSAVQATTPEPVSNGTLASTASEMELMPITNSPPPMNEPAGATDNTTVLTTNDTSTLSKDLDFNKPATPTATSTANKSITVAPNESLWLIANRIAKDTSARTERVMANIYASNPAAFIANNPARIKANANIVLRDAEELSTAERKRAENFLAGRTGKALTQKPKKAVLAKAKRPKKQRSPVSPAQNSNENQLVLVSPSNSGSSTGNTPSVSNNTSNPTYSKDLTAQREQTKQSRNKVRSLVQSVANNDAKLALLNDQIAELQKQLEEKRKKAINKS